MTPGDNAQVRAVIGAAWAVNYTHIYEPAELDAIITGRMPQSATWLKYRAERLPSCVAEVDGHVDGVIGLSLLVDGDGEITQLYIHPAAQGRGTGAALWRQGLAALRAAGCDRAWVWALEKATQAVDFYTRQGGQPTGRGIFSVGDHDETAIGFVFEL